MDHPSAGSIGDDWELDPAEVTFHERIASGAFGDLFRGSYCGQDVAIKVLKNVQDDSQQYREFLQVCSPDTQPLAMRSLIFCHCGVLEIKMH